MDSVQISKESLVVVGASNLNAQLWSGQIYIFQYNTTPTGAEFVQKKCIPTLDGGVPAVDWIGDKSDIVVSGSDNGSIHFWHTGQKKDRPLRSIREHHDVVVAVVVSPHQSDTFLSASWDTTIKLWLPKATHSSQTFQGHLGFVWDVSWDVKSENVFASASQDASVKIWDTRLSTTQSCTHTIRTDRIPQYSVSFNPFNNNQVVSGGQDGAVRVYDIRETTKAVKLITPHTLAVRKVRFSPHSENIIATASDDNTHTITHTTDSQVVSTHKHGDFVRGLAWSKQGQSKVLLSGSWDGAVQSWSA